MRRKFIVTFCCLVLCICTLFCTTGCDLLSELFGGNPVVTPNGGGSGGGSTGGSNGGGSTDTTKTVTVTLNLNGGSGVSSLTYSGKEGSTLSLPTPTKENATFEGWYEDDEKVGNPNVYPSKDKTYTAKYTLNSDQNVTIAFASEKGKVYDEIYVHFIKSDYLFGEDLANFESMLKFANAVHVTCTFYASSDGKTSFEISMYGAGGKPITSETYRDELYTKHTLIGTASSALFTPKPRGDFFILTKTDGMGASYIKDISVTFEFVLPQGSLV